MPQRREALLSLRCGFLDAGRFIGSRKYYGDTTMGAIRFLVYTIMLGSFAATALTVVSERWCVRARPGLSRRAIRTDWSFVLGLTLLGLFALRSEGIVRSGHALGTMIALWPLPFVYWWLNLRHWTLLTYNPARSKREHH
jgi:hypothetical protein